MHNFHHPPIYCSLTCNLHPKQYLPTLIKSANNVSSGVGFIPLLQSPKMYNIVCVDAHCYSDGCTFSATEIPHTFSKTSSSTSMTSLPRWWPRILPTVVFPAPGLPMRIMLLPFCSQKIKTIIIVITPCHFKAKAMFYMTAGITSSIGG